MTSRLASLLVQDGKVSAKRMAQAFQRQAIFGGTLDTILLEMGFVDEQLVLDYLGRAASMPPVAAPRQGPGPGAAEAVSGGFSAALAERSRAVPWALSGGTLEVLVTDPPDRESLVQLGAQLGMALDPRIGPECRFHQAMETLFGVALPERFATLATRLAAQPAPTAPAPTTTTTTTTTVPASPAASAAPVETAPSPSPPPAQPPPQRPSPLHRNTIETAPVPTPIASRRAEAPATIPELPRLRPHASPGGPPSSPTLSGVAAVAEAPETVAEEPPETFVSPPTSVAARPAADLAAAAAAMLATDQAAAAAPVGASLLDAAPPPYPWPGADRVAAPAEVASLTAEPIAEEPHTPPPTMALADGIAALQAASDRDAVFEVLCQIARERFAFVAVFTVQGELASARHALGDGWFDRRALDGATVDLGAPSALRVAVQGNAPFLGRVGEDGPLGGILRFLGRPAPLPAALVPIVLRDRAVAVLYVDADGRVVEVEELTGLIQAGAESGKAFLRLIKAAKKKGREAADEAPVAERRVTSPASVPELVAPTWANAPTTKPDLPVLEHSSPPPPPPSQAPATNPDLRRVRSPSSRDHLARAAALANAFEPQSARADGMAQLGGATDVASLVATVERDDATSAPAADLLLTLGPPAAQAVVDRLPGPLRFGHRKLNTVALPLAEHGPLVAVVPRFGSAVVPLLVSRLDDPSPDVRYYVVLALAELRPDPMIAPLGQRLFDVDTAVRRAAAMALGRYPSSPALRALIDGLRGELVSPDLARQRHAAVALGELRDAPSVPRLVDLLKHRDMEIVDLAHRALVLITKQDFGTTRWRWRSWWEKHREQSRLDWLLAGLEQPSLDARRSAAEELSAIATERFGFHGAFPRREREEAARRWAAWYMQNSGGLGEERKS